MTTDYCPCCGSGIGHCRCNTARPRVEYTTNPHTEIIVGCQECSRLRSRVERLEELVRDCMAIIRGDLSGPAQVAGVLKEAATALQGKGE